MGGLFFLFDVTLDIFQGKSIYLGKVRSHAPRQFGEEKRVIYHGKSVLCNNTYSCWLQKNIEALVWSLNKQHFFTTVHCKPHLCKVHEDNP